MHVMRGGMGKNVLTTTGQLPWMATEHNARSASGPRHDAEDRPAESDSEKIPYEEKSNEEQ